MRQYLTGTIFSVYAWASKACSPDNSVHDPFQIEYAMLHIIMPPQEAITRALRQWTAMAMTACLLVGCAGGRSATEPPTHLQAGQPEASKGAELYQRGCYHRALALFFTAHRKFSATDQSVGVAMCLNNIGTIYRALGDAETAALFFQEAQNLYQQLDDRNAATQALCNSAAALMDLERLDEAQAALDNAGTLLPAGQPPPYLLKNRGVLMMKKGAFAQAEPLLRAALDHTEPENIAALGAARSAMGSLMRQTGRPEAAAGYYRAALEADRTAGFYKGMADDLATLADLTETLTEKVALLKRSIKIYALTGNQKRVAEVVDALETLSEQTGVNIDLTRHFVQTWLDDPSGWTPCR